MNNTPLADWPSPVVEPNVVAPDLVTHVGRNSGSSLSTMLKPGRRRKIGASAALPQTLANHATFRLAPSLSPARSPLGLLCRALLWHDPPGLHANLAPAFMMDHS